MKNESTTAARHSLSRNVRFTCAVGAALLGTAVLMAPINTIAAERSGKEVVAAICGNCHATGKDGAHKIGDRQAWGKLTARGLTSLTKSALAGFRKMPAHGGSAEATDLDISRAITHMINQSGGNWIEPVGKAMPAPIPIVPKERTGQQIVQTQCGKCHVTGEAGAPKLGDRDAWVQRLKRGLDELVRSAFNGHGPMPARGGLADITVNEMRNSITYMFNPASATMVRPVTATALPQDPFHKSVGNTEIFFGIASAQSIRAAQKNPDAASITNVPEGADYYHINVSLRDRVTKVPVINAAVDARVEDPAFRGESKSLDILAINKGISYGNFFQLPTKGRYVIIVKIQRADSPPGEARFEFNRN
jgi:cytochrome c5